MWWAYSSLLLSLSPSSIHTPLPAHTHCSSLPHLADAGQNGLAPLLGLVLAALRLEGGAVGLPLLSPLLPLLIQPLLQAGQRCGVQQGVDT